MAEMKNDEKEHVYRSMKEFADSNGFCGFQLCALASSRLCVHLI